MKNCSRIPKLPSNIEEVLTTSSILVDNLYAECCRLLDLRTLLNRAGITKRSGLDAAQTVFLLLMRVFLHDSSIAMFCRKSMQEFIQASKDPLYDLLKNQTINWRSFHQLMALKVYRSLDLRL